MANVTFVDPVASISQFYTACCQNLITCVCVCVIIQSFISFTNKVKGMK